MSHSDQPLNPLARLVAGLALCALLLLAAGLALMIVMVIVSTAHGYVF